MCASKLCAYSARFGLRRDEFSSMMVFVSKSSLLCTRRSLDSVRPCDLPKLSSVLASLSYVFLPLRSKISFILRGSSVASVSNTYSLMGFRTDPWTQM